MSNSITIDQNDQSVTNEIEFHHIFFDNEQQDLESDNDIDDFLSELPKNFLKKMKSLAMIQMKTETSGSWNCSYY